MCAYENIHKFVLSNYIVSHKALFFNIQFDQISFSVILMCCVQFGLSTMGTNCKAKNLPKDANKISKSCDTKNGTWRKPEVKNGKYIITENRKLPEAKVGKIVPTYNVVLYLFTNINPEIMVKSNKTLRRHKF